MISNDKIAAIYELREAVETKVLAEVALDAQPSSETRNALLDATLELEAKTQNAIDVCHECGNRHAVDNVHGNVINVDFRNGSGPEDQTPPTG